MKPNAYRRKGPPSRVSSRRIARKNPVPLVSLRLPQQKRISHLSTKKYVVQPASSSAPTSTV